MRLPSNSHRNLAEEVEFSGCVQICGSAVHGAEWLSQSGGSRSNEGEAKCLMSAFRNSLTANYACLN